MARFIPTFCLETFNRLNASKPAQMIRLHRPQSALMAGLSEGKRVPYRLASKSASASAESVETCAECDMEVDECTCDQCGECGEHVDNCECCGECQRAPGYCNCCGDCGMRAYECECNEDGSDCSQSDAMCDKGTGDVRIVRGGEYGWRVKWAGDPQPHRDRSFRTQEKAEACKRAIETYMAEGEFLGAGRHRAGWLVGGLTVKVAMSEDGIQANTSEVEVSKSAPIPVPDTAPLCAVSILAEYAPRLPRLEARKILDTPGNPFEGHWIDADDFGPQLGRLPNGKIVCFDFSAN